MTTILDDALVSDLEPSRAGDPVGRSRRPDAVPGHEHDPRRGLPGRSAQPLALEPHAWPCRRADRHRRRAVCHRFLTGVADPARALPRRCDPRRGERDSRVAPQRGWNILIPSVWTDAGDTEANIAWTRQTFAAMRPHLGTGRWLNYFGADQAEDAVRAAYGPISDRLREVKRRYDPDNAFHLNHNIRIGEG